MVTWVDAVTRINAGTMTPLDQPQRRFSFNEQPLAVVGASGAGKTRIWSRLTGKPAPDQMSLATDNGYMLRPNKRYATIRTVPGQQSKLRRYTLDQLFGEVLKLTGVIFVATFGYDHIWHRAVDVVAAGLNPYDLIALRERNLIQELDRYSELCDRIAEKIETADRSKCPDFLVIAVNKADLYWPELTAVQNYYLVNSGSAFDNITTRLKQQIGFERLNIQVLPVAVEAKNYLFHSMLLGQLTGPTQLGQLQCEESLKCLVETIGDLCDD